MFNCIFPIIIPELKLAIEVPAKDGTLIEVEQATLLIEHELCVGTAVELTSVQQQLEVIQQNNLLLEVPKNIILIEYPKCVNIEETAPSPSVLDAETIIGTYEAASTISANRVIVLAPDGRIEHADALTTLDACDIIGIARQSGAIGSLIEVVKFGKLTGATIGIIGDNFFLGTNGNLTTSPLAGGIWLVVATQNRSSELFVHIQEPILT